MPHSIWNRETLLDITVNLVPLFILLFFTVMYAVWTPWTGEPLIYAMMHVLTVLPLLLLALLTYIAAQYL
ncbi:DUF6684 family protein [Halomicrococcus sp. SG-WS-1]|uniref:DUF6684 family protein n=1 Tax=Halomicrococcus sp. SG-WS-1 TaxID=3439057 RepID=UPI003F79B71C